MSLCRSTRRASVFTPRRSSQQSNGEGTAPRAFWWKRSCFSRASSLVIRAPATTSLWPPMYLVALWTTTSAPRCSGCCRYGVAKVLSTQTMAPRPCAISLTASMSTTRSRGLVGDSSQTIRVFGVSERSTTSRSEASMALNSRPNRFRTLSKRRKVPP